MINYQDFDILGNDELISIINYCKDKLKKKNSILGEFFSQFKEPENYTLNDLYGIYKNSSINPINQDIFNIAVVRMIKDEEINLKNIKVNQPEQILNKQKIKQSLLDQVDQAEKKG